MSSRWWLSWWRKRGTRQVCVRAQTIPVPVTHPTCGSMPPLTEGERAGGCCYTDSHVQRRTLHGLLSRHCKA